MSDVPPPRRPAFVPPAPRPDTSLQRRLATAPDAPGEWTPVEPSEAGEGSPEAPDGWSGCDTYVMARLRVQTSPTDGGRRVEARAFLGGTDWHPVDPKLLEGSPWANVPDGQWLVIEPWASVPSWFETIPGAVVGKPKD